MSVSPSKLVQEVMELNSLVQHSNGQFLVENLAHNRYSDMKNRILKKNVIPFSQGQRF